MAYTFACKDAQHACLWRARANTQEELKAQVVEHVVNIHHVPVATDTIWNFVSQKIKQA